MWAGWIGKEQRGGLLNPSSEQRRGIGDGVEWSGVEDWFGLVWAAELELELELVELVELRREGGGGI